MMQTMLYRETVRWKVGEINGEKKCTRVYMESIVGGEAGDIWLAEDSKEQGVERRVNVLDEVGNLEAMRMVERMVEQISENKDKDRHE